MSFAISEVDVVYAEDQEAFRMITIPVLVKAGIVEDNILVAEDGKEAIDHFLDLQAKGSRRPMLVLLDVRMPIMDGNRCATEIKMMVDEKKAVRCPYVVLLTAFLDKRVEEESHNGAVQLSVPKPLDKNQIQHVIGGFERWWGSKASKDTTGMPKAPASAKAPGDTPLLERLGAFQGSDGFGGFPGYGAPAKAPAMARYDSALAKPAPYNPGFADASLFGGYPSKSDGAPATTPYIPKMLHEADRPARSSSKRLAEAAPAKKVTYKPGELVLFGRGLIDSSPKNSNPHATGLSSGAPAKNAPYNAGEINIIVAGDEPVCNMALITSLSLVGAEDDLVLQAGSKDELMDTFGQIQGDTRPLVLFVANASWLSVVRQVVSSLSATSSKPYGSKPYIVCADEEGERGIKNFDAVLPAPYSQADLDKVLVACHRLWART